MLFLRRLLGLSHGDWSFATLSNIGLADLSHTVDKSFGAVDGNIFFPPGITDLPMMKELSMEFVTCGCYRGDTD